MAHYEEGDLVALEVLYASGVPPKLHPGTVIAVGKKGVQVRFDDTKRPPMWLRGDQVRVLERAKPDAGARVERTPPPPAPPPASPPAPKPVEVPPPRQVRPQEALSSLEAWRAMGRELLADASEALQFAEIDAMNADEDLRVAKEASEAAHRRCLELREQLTRVRKVVGDGA